MLAERFPSIPSSHASPSVDPIEASDQIEALLRRRLRLLAEQSHVGPSGTGETFVAGAPLVWWRRLIVGWLTDDALVRQVGSEAVAGARLAICDFADDDLALYVEALIGVDL